MLQVREKEADLDSLIGPIEEMYALLRRYEVRVPAKELDAVSDLRYSWRKLHDLASVTSNALSQLQVWAQGLGFRVYDLGFSDLRKAARPGLHDLQCPLPAAGGPAGLSLPR